MMRNPLDEVSFFANRTRPRNVIKQITVKSKKLHRFNFYFAKSKPSKSRNLENSKNSLTC